MRTTTDGRPVPVLCDSCGTVAGRTWETSDGQRVCRMCIAEAPQLGSVAEALVTMGHALHLAGRTPLCRACRLITEAAA